MSENSNDRAEWLAATEGVQPLKPTKFITMLQRNNRTPVRVIVKRPRPQASNPTSNPVPLATWVVTKPIHEIKPPPRPVTERDILRLVNKFNPK